MSGFEFRGLKILTKSGWSAGSKFSRGLGFRVSSLTSLVGRGLGFQLVSLGVWGLTSGLGSELDLDLCVYLFTHKEVIDVKVNPNTKDETFGFNLHPMG